MTTATNTTRRRVRHMTTLVALAGTALTLPAVTQGTAAQALPAPQSCADVAIVEAGTTINCIVAAGETVEFTAVSGHGGAGGRGGFGGAGLSVDFDDTFLLGGFGGSGGFGGAGGAGRMATGSYTNETGDPVTLTIEVGNNGAAGADGADGADGTAEQPFGEFGQDGQDGAKGGAAYIIVGSGLGPNQIGALDVQYIVEVEGGAGGLGGQGGLGGTPADTENSLPGEDGADGALGLPGADGTISPDPLPDGWTTGYSDGTPRVILSVNTPDPAPSDLNLTCAIPPLLDGASVTVNGVLITASSVSADVWPGTFGPAADTVYDFDNAGAAATTLQFTPPITAIRAETFFHDDAINAYPIGDIGNYESFIFSGTTERSAEALYESIINENGVFDFLPDREVTGTIAELTVNYTYDEAANEAPLASQPTRRSLLQLFIDCPAATPPTPTPTPGVSAPAPFQPVLPDLSDVTAGNAPGVIEFTNLPAGAVVSVASDAADSVKGVGSVSIVDGKVTVTPDAGFSGIINLPVSVNIGGTVTTITVTITVNPAPAEDGSFTPSTGAQWWPSPRAFSGTTVSWNPSGNAIGYEVWLVIPGVPGALSVQSADRVLLCTATATSCVVDRLVGPNSTLELVATGNDGTRSTTVLPAYRSAEFTRVLNVMFGGDSSRLSATAKAELDLLAFVIAAEGYSQVQITSHISSNRPTAFGRKLSQARADVVAKYLSARVGRTVTVTTVSEVNARPVASNSTPAGREANRRAEISVR